LECARRAVLAVRSPRRHNRRLAFPAMKPADQIKVLDAAVTAELSGTEVAMPGTSPELIELARAKPGQLRYGSPGIGSSPHLTGELLQSMAGIDLVHVAYKGSPQYTIDLLAGRIDFVFAAAGALLPHIKSGRLRLLAVGSASRDPAMPDVPAVNETVPGFEVVGWYGLLTTAGTPAPVIKKLHAELVRILGEPDVKTLYANAGLETAISASPAQFAAYIASEREKWAKVVKAANIRLE